MRTETHCAIQHRSAMAPVSALTLMSDRAFPRHTHDEVGFGVMTFGAQRSWSGIGSVEAQAGDVITVNPGEMHDGLPFDGRPRGWRMLYLDPTILHRETEPDAASGWAFAQPVLRDAGLAASIDRLFARLAEPVPDRLAIEEDTLRCLARARQHGHRPPPRRAPPPAVARALQRLDEAPEDPVSLTELAALGQMSRTQLLRGFAKETGTTPHAYLVQRRVGLARRFLARGVAVAAAAQQAGFADQSHLTRAFVRQFGITPARYRSALR